jgi:hypothetical protein
LTRQLGAESACYWRVSAVRLGEARTQLRNTVEDGFNIGDKTSEYFDPFEDLVVQQAIRDASEGLAKQDMAQYARDISSGGESAFGSRARLSAEERAEAMGRGLAREVGGIRSAGFQRAQQTAIGEDERARQAQRTASSGLASLAGQELGAERGLIDRAAQASQQRYGAAQRSSGNAAAASCERAWVRYSARRYLSAGRSTKIWGGPATCWSGPASGRAKNWRQAKVTAT